MKKSMGRTSMGLLFSILVTLSGSGVLAEEASALDKKLKQHIQSAMQKHIVHQTVKGNYVIYDAIEGHLKHLKFKKLHEAVLQKGPYYVSCADFTDQTGKLYDLDLLVTHTPTGFKILESIVHAIDGKKRTYHMEE